MWIGERSLIVAYKQNRIMATTIHSGRSALKQLLTDFRQLGHAQQSPGLLAAAFALGTLLSFIPAPFLDTLLVGLIVTRFPQVNRPALLSARFIWNDLIVVPLYAPGFRLGMALLTHAHTPAGLEVLAFLLGALLLGVAATLLSAWLVFCLFSLRSSRTHHSSE
jgi:uncharacterized protein (DUF2062 family)